MVLVTVPRTDDMHIVLIKALLDEAAVFVDNVDDLRNTHAFTRGPALVGAQISIGVAAPLVTNQSHFDVVDRHDAGRSVRELVAPADLEFRHFIPSTLLVRRL